LRLKNWNGALNPGAPFSLLHWALSILGTVKEQKFLSSFWKMLNRRSLPKIGG